MLRGWSCYVDKKYEDLAIENGMSLNREIISCYENRYCKEMRFGGARMSKLVGERYNNNDSRTLR